MLVSLGFSAILWLQTIALQMATLPVKQNKQTRKGREQLNGFHFGLAGYVILVFLIGLEQRTYILAAGSPIYPGKYAAMLVEIIIINRFDNA